MLLILVNLAALALLFGLSIDWWGRLPEDVAPPGAETGPGLFEWFALPAMGAFVGLFFLGLGLLKGVSLRHPWLVSIPRRHLFMALPLEGKRRVLDVTFRLLALFPLPVYGYLLIGQWANFDVAVKGGDPFPHWIVWAFMAASLAIIAVYIAAVSAAVGSEAKAAGAGTERR